MPAALIGGPYQSAWDLIDCLGQQAAVDGYSLGAKFSHYIDLSVEVAKHLKLPEGTPLSLADMCTRTRSGYDAPAPQTG